MLFLQFAITLAIFFLAAWIGTGYMMESTPPEKDSNEHVALLYKLQKLKEELKALAILGRNAEAIFVQAQLRSLVAAMEKANGIKRRV